MDGKGAYAQVTAPIGDDTQVTVKEGKGTGTGAFCTRKKLICAVIVALIIIIIIILIAVLSTMNNKSAQSVQATTRAPSVTKDKVTSGVSMPPSSMPGSAMVTTLPPPTTTTFGPPVRGSFQGSLVFDRAYIDSFDDMRAQGTTEFMANITAALAQVLDVPSAPYQFVQTYVDRLLQNGTNVAAQFTVSLDAINRGASTRLLDTIGTLPSTVLQTYPVLIVDLKPETQIQTDA